jgi:hypothetical protein
VWDSQGTGAPRVVGAKSDGAPEGEASGWQSGVSWAGGDDRVRARWWPDRQLFIGYDAAQREGWWWTTDATATAWYERAAPLRALVHFWAQAERLHLVHAAAVGTGDGRGVLLAGPSGSGKSTTALACLAAPLVFVGDDYALFEPGTPPLVHALYGTAKVDPTSMQWLPELQGARRRASGTEGEKLVLDVGRAMPKKLASCLTVEAVLVARRTATGPRVVSVDRPSALRALAPSTLLQLDRHGAARSLQAMARLLEQVPTYALELGPDPRAVPPCLADLLRAGGPS